MMSYFQILIRDEQLPADTTVLLHLGSSDERSFKKKLDNLLRGHDGWIGVLDDAGRFAVSAYALNQVDEVTILRQMRHGQYGRSTVGDVRDAGYRMLPTSITLARGDNLIRDLQPYHYSILLRTSGLQIRLLDEPDELEQAKQFIKPDLRRLLGLFEPTLDNDWRVAQEGSSSSTST